MLTYSRNEAGDNNEHHKFKQANHKGRAVKITHRLDHSEHRSRRLETREVCPQFFLCFCLDIDITMSQSHVLGVLPMD